MGRNYCETIVCSVINSAFALQLLQDIMIHVSLSSCYGCPRKLVEICTYCFPFSPPPQIPSTFSSVTFSSFTPHCTFEELFADRDCYILYLCTPFLYIIGVLPKCGQNLSSLMAIRATDHCCNGKLRTANTS